MAISPRLLLLLPLLALAGGAGAQSFGIGTTTPHSSAQLDVTSTSKGLLLPRLSQTQLNALSGPAPGLLVYNTSTDQLNLWNGAGWQSILTLGPTTTAPEQTFTTVGASTYTVPANTYALDVTLTGASGGIGGVSGPSVTRGRAGGGGIVSARLFVQPGQSFEVRVGGQGTSYFSAANGGYNGGGNGGGMGAGGGGATDMRAPGSGYGGRALVAGGGGGASGGSVARAGGSAGHPDGGQGDDPYGGGVMGGRGGTQSGGGAAGQPFVVGGTTYGVAGSNGGFGDGAAKNNYGGAGGGGYYGGGSGAYYEEHVFLNTWGGGGGGGGSSHAGAGTGLATFQSNGTTTTPVDGRASIRPVTTAAAPALDATNISNLQLPWQRTGSLLHQRWATEYVGIGTATPGLPLDVVGSARLSSGPVEIQNDNANAYLWFHDPGDAYFSVGMDRNDNNNFEISEGDNPSGNFRHYLTIRRSNGCIGIGTNTPVAPLHVVPKMSIGQYDFAWYSLKRNIFLGVWVAEFGHVGGTTPNDVSIKAEGRFVAAEFNSTSDRRLKQVVGLSDRSADLGLLRKLRITDYQLLDRARYGNQPFKKVIAQEVEEVFPQAVTQKTGFLPDIYAAATRAEALPGDTLLRLTLPAAPARTPRRGQRIRLAGPAGEVTGTVVQAAGPVLTVRGAQALARQSVFVFGLEHQDVRAVDYEALAMLNVSATQALDDHLRELRAQQTRLLYSTGQASQAAGQARQQARQALTTATAATTAIQDFEQELAAAETRLGLSKP